MTVGTPHLFAGVYASVSVFALGDVFAPVGKPVLLSGVYASVGKPVLLVGVFAPVGKPVLLGGVFAPVGKPVLLSGVFAPVGKPVLLKTGAPGKPVLRGYKNKMGFRLAEAHL